MYFCTRKSSPDTFLGNVAKRPSKISTLPKVSKIIEKNKINAIQSPAVVLKRLERFEKIISNKKHVNISEEVKNKTEIGIPKSKNIELKKSTVVLVDISSNGKCSLIT